MLPQPQHPLQTPQIEAFCQQVTAATGHECRPYRAGIFCIEGKGNGRIVTFQCNELAPEKFPMVLERIIKPSTAALYA